MSNRSYVESGHSEFHDESRARRVAGALLDLRLAQTLADTFSVLGDPTRARIVHALSVAELCVSDLARLLGVSHSAASHQLRLLRDRRVVSLRRDGRHTFYRLADAHIRTLVDMGLSHATEEHKERQ